MGEIKIEGEDPKDLGLTLVADEVAEIDEDDALDYTDDVVLEVADLDDAGIEIVLVVPTPADTPDEEPTREEDVEEDLLSQLEAILSPGAAGSTGEEEEEGDVVAPKRKKAKTVDDEDEDLGEVRPRQKNEVHCHRCYILVKVTIGKCPVGEDECPVMACKKQ